jgi:hypothetical protein
MYSRRQTILVPGTLRCSSDGVTYIALEPESAQLRKITHLPPAHSPQRRKPGLIKLSMKSLPIPNVLLASGCSKCLKSAENEAGSELVAANFALRAKKPLCARALCSARPPLPRRRVLRGGKTRPTSRLLSSPRAARRVSSLVHGLREVARRLLFCTFRFLSPPPAVR